MHQYLQNHVNAAHAHTQPMPMHHLCPTASIARFHICQPPRNGCSSTLLLDLAGCKLSSLQQCATLTCLLLACCRAA